jgi:hypothetical protein
MVNSARVSVFGLVAIALFAGYGLADAGNFWSDGNLSVFIEDTQSGRQRFVANAGLTEGANREMVFGSAVARMVGTPTALWNDARRETVATEVLMLLAQVPPPSEEADERSTEELLQGLGWGADKVGLASDYLNAYRMDYWSSTLRGADLHNTIAKWLREINPRSVRTVGGRAFPTTNLEHLGAAMGVLDDALVVSEVAIGACLRAAVEADEALYRLEFLESALSSSKDPAINAAFANARRQLINGQNVWGALIEEISSRRAEFAAMTGAAAFKYAMKAAGAKGTLGLVLVYETIVSDWNQHDNAQIAVMASTLEEFIRSAPGSGTPADATCELRKAAAMARFVYLDRMVEVTGVWQGRWYDLLSQDRPYAEAKQYFEEKSRTYGGELVDLRSRSCFSLAVSEAPKPAAPIGCDAIDLALLIDSSGSMQENDPRSLRKQAASLLVDRVPSGTVFSVIDFDDSASVYLSRSPDASAAKNAVQRVDAKGGTNIENALKTGYQALASGSGARAAILFTDGRSTNRGGTEGYIQDGIPVHVVGLGSGVDTDYLQRLAASTNGLYMHAAGAVDLAEVFDRVVSELACEGTVLSKAAMIKPGEELEYGFFVDATLNRVVARVTWPGSIVGLQLIDPSGRTVGVEIASGPTYRIVAVDVPEPGTWKVRVIGTEVNPSGEPISLRVGGPSNLRLAAMQPDRQDPSLIQVSVIDNGVGANVRRSWSRIKTPKGKVTTGPPLTPSGTGTFSLAVPVEDGGIYTVTAGLEGDSPTARQWAREITRTVVIGSGMVPWRGSITRVEGSYLTINRGSRHGVREGMTVILKPGNLPAGTGLVVSTFTSTSTVEVQELSGSALPTQGMTIELDRKQWMADVKW